MARSCISTGKWACGHPEKHREAAYKGWATRRRGAAWRSSDEHKAVSHFLESEVRDAHEHSEHKGMTRFHEGGRWWEVPTKEFQGWVKLGKGQMKAKEREAVRQAKEQERATKHQQKEERQRKVVEELQEREAARPRREQHAAVTKWIRASGGIRPYRTNLAGKTPEKEEWRELPKHLRTTNSRAPTMDTMAQELNSQFPGLNLQSDSDLVAYLRQEKAYREREQRRRRAS